MCSALAYTTSQRVSLACVRTGIKTFVAALSMLDPIQPISATVVSVDDREDFLSLEKFANNDAFLLGSNKRIIMLRYAEGGGVEAIDNLCYFPTDPLISFSLRANNVFCLQERSVSLVELQAASRASTIPHREHGGVEDSVADANMFSTHPKDQPEPQPVQLQPISRSAVKKQQFEVPPTLPIFRDLEEMSGSTDSTKRVSLPFDVGRVKRIFADTENDRILFGGEILNVMVNVGGGYKICEERVAVSYFSATPTGSGLILLNDWVSNDLIVVDRNYREVNRYHGVPDMRRVENIGMKYIHQGRDGVLWLAGSSRVVRVNYDLTMEDMKIFDEDFIHTYKPYIYILQSTNKNTLHMIVKLEEKGQAVVVSDPNNTHVVPLTNLEGEMKGVDSMLYDEDFDMIVLGGSTHIDRTARKAKAVLYIVRVESRARVVATKILDGNTQTVSMIKKDRGYYYLAMKGAVSVCRYDHENGQIREIHSVVHHLGMLINDICIFNRVLLSVSEFDDSINATSLEFIQ